MYKSKYFKTYELLPQRIENMIKKDSVKYGMIDDDILRFMDWARERYGSLTVNDYKWGGSNQWRGLRIPESKYYSNESMHSYGKAIDFVSRKFTAEQIINDLKDLNKKLLVPHISRVEDLSGMTWVHVDVKNINQKGIHFFKP